MIFFLSLEDSAGANCAFHCLTSVLFIPTPMPHLYHSVLTMLRTGCAWVAHEWCISEFDTTSHSGAVSAMYCQGIEYHEVNCSFLCLTYVLCSAFYKHEHFQGQLLFPLPDLCFVL